MLISINRNELAVNRTIIESLHSLAGVKHHNMVPNNSTVLLKLNINWLNLALLIKSTQEAMEKFGSWNYRLGMKNEQVLHDVGYGGIGLTYNPTHNELEGSDIHEHVQGNPRPAAGMKNPFSTVSAADGIRNSHYDTYGLSYRTPASKHGYLGTFLDTCKRTMVRSAVRIIYAENEGPVKLGEDKYAGVTWHKDEPMFENLRVNIPLVTDPIFVLEQEGRTPNHLEAGYAYTWDTGISHRAYAKVKAPKHRIHLMLGFSCWWDFNEETGVWSQNDFFGKKHPKDMLIDGDVIPGLSL